MSPPLLVMPTELTQQDPQLNSCGHVECETCLSTMTALHAREHYKARESHYARHRDRVNRPRRCHNFYTKGDGGATWIYASCQTDTVTYFLTAGLQPDDLLPSSHKTQELASRFTSVTHGPDTSRLYDDFSFHSEYPTTVSSAPRNTGSWGTNISTTSSSASSVPSTIPFMARHKSYHGDQNLQGTSQRTLTTRHSLAAS